MENKFKKGMILGGLLAVAAAVGFALTKDGQKLSEDLQGDLKDLAKQLKKQLHEAQDVTQDSFDSMVATLVEEYAKTKELAEDKKNELVASLQSKWKEMEEEYLSEQEGA